MERTSNLSMDALKECLEYLPVTAVVSLSLTSKHFRGLCEDDSIWRYIFCVQLGIKQLIPPPASTSPVPPSSFKRAVCMWMNHFRGYSWEEVSLAYHWWRRMEVWLRAHAPSILATLNPPLHPSIIAGLERASLIRAPRMVKLLYMFHDGQTLRFPEVPRDNREHLRMLLQGMFGSFVADSPMTNVRLLTFEHAISESRNRRRELGVCQWRKPEANEIFCANPFCFAINVPVAGSRNEFFVSVNEMVLGSPWELGNRWVNEYAYHGKIIVQIGLSHVLGSQ